jgi:hypothetical protein
MATGQAVDCNQDLGHEIESVDQAQHGEQMNGNDAHIYEQIAAQ